MTLLPQIQQGEAFQALDKALKSGASVLIEELWNSPKALLAALALQITQKHVLIITGASAEENKLLLDAPFFTDFPIVDFPAWETLPNENIAPSPDTVGERYRTLNTLQTAERPYIVTAVLQACLQKVIVPKKFNSLFLALKIGDTISYEELIAKLEAMGYKRQPVAADKGEFAIRGGIVDVFPVSSPSPYRLEFFGNEIDSMRIYDPFSQTSVSGVTDITLTPSLELEFLPQEQELGTLLDYLGPNTLVIIDDLLSVEDRAAALKTLTGSGNKFFSSLEELFERIEPLQKIYYSSLPIEELSEVRTDRKKGYYSSGNYIVDMTFSMFDRKLKAQRWKHPFANINEYLFPDAQEGETRTADQIIEALHHVPQEVPIVGISENPRDFSKFSLPNRLTFAQGYLSSGIVIEDNPLIIFPVTELTKRYKIRRQKLRTIYHNVPSQMFDPLPGDLVVHLNNGIGKYVGIEKRANHLGHESEFLLLDYADNARLYVPIQQAHLVTKYIGATDDIPQLHTLGSSKWKKIKENTQKAILGYAKDLLDLYAKRQLHKGFSVEQDSSDMHAFEEEFPFVETEDQVKAINQIKTDMQSEKPMDRLICGDVGNGKTEVAMRAAFKAVVDGGKQVALLVPTTVLAMQHFDNFTERMRNFPISIEVVSRFRTAKQTRETLERLKNGTVDILIGTHRIVSQDVEFKNLGLVIIDEEQRFGVRAKEHLKKIKTNVDCLTLSATPIPRTLYMSLVGARDMSLINTPPEDRLPISTIVAEDSEELYRTALLRELARDGQAFFIHNRVETIYSVAEKLQKLLPHARIGVAHGQMHADEIDSVFHAFKNGQTDILVATTIIENGIDIPNANTILIDRADHYGLASLYQMRGRVGRWNRRAYAYFMVKNKRTLNETARKRLHALAEASSQGGGMKVAMRDLEIRGAGDILGVEQSGHVAAIGFHFYCKLLKRTVEALQGKHPFTLHDVKVEFPIDARLPEYYINEVSLRMEIYQKLGEAYTLDEIDVIWGEILDRFGTPPLPAQWLYYLSRIRVQAAAKGYTLLKWENMVLTTEKRIGKDVQTHKQIMKPCKEPQDLEALVIKLLK